MNPNSFFEDYYNKPDWWFKLRYDTQSKVKSALYALKKVNFESRGKDIFEFGFGSGELLLRFKKPEGIYGVEVSSSAIEKIFAKAAKSGISNFGFKSASNDEIRSFKQSGFELVVASHVIEHIENTDEFISHIKYLLKDEGLVLIQIPINEKFKDPKHVNEYSTESLLKYFADHGFVCITNFENELIFCLVEKLYIKNMQGNWSLTDNLKRISFNLIFSILPFGVSRIIDRIISRITKQKPRQSVAIFKRK